jgi:DNA-binding NarL/FixJ family response regulator
VRDASTTRPSAPSSPPRGTAWPSARELPAGLTPRELEVLLALARGGSNQGIADDLGISVKTAGHHVQHVYEKVGVRTRAAATLWAFEHDLVRAAA